MQVSATSQPPATAARHTVAAERNASAGQALPAPSQVSARSQTPAEARHTVPLGTKPSPGHAPEAPVQVSATSQTPAEARQISADDAKRSGGQATPKPLQDSATSQIPPAGRHTCDAGATASARSLKLLLATVLFAVSAVMFYRSLP